MKKEYLIYKLSEEMKEATRIDTELFSKFDVKRGLRNEDGTGVLVGLTRIGNVVGYERVPGGGLKPIPGKLFYRGYDVEDISHAIIKEKRFGFEEVAYLLLSGRLPDKEELLSFRELINDNMPLEQKTKMNIIELEGNNIMNILSRSVLEMYRFDANADDTSRDNLMRQSIELISKFPTIIAYAYNMLRHATFGRSLHIRHPQEKLSIAENFLYMLKKDYTELDARTLDLLLILQAEHGGGNNSTFTVRVNSRCRKTAKGQCFLCRINLRHNFTEQQQEEGQDDGQYQELCQRRMENKHIHKEEIAEHDNGHIHKIVRNQYRCQETFGVPKKSTYFIVGRMIALINIIPIRRR